ncbi:probable dolichyl pyrophosphate Glc1Man9GlcNAc2 alpha-1,3-glucosyltransferase [Macrosteles quadrilineatus]|uniref:probable dolichyl pyrophosphate Glc1Man9GlcNAc2 alpha-1,3-glucosyltransferase n=1 Tax=Macrosteles quadrilineatus TaxID=74068 RepID=UPI0023E17C9A|nr:probable dolichyl pyrophosphate Glc1Man9GlcNAc2 alpha-1,3-glucosyltransferase [Macrosteles quadrilineatus]
MFWTLVFMVSCIKLLLIPAYRSTDFEVHRNWLAITHSLPLRQWYNEATSEWTLDYPPLFAWFEFILSQIAVFFDPKMLQVKNLNYASYETVVFQRLTVIVTDLVFAYGIKECCQYLSGSGVRKSSRWGLRWGSPAAILQLLLLGNAGLIIVDHIHFQYNGFLFGVLLLSVARILQGRFLEGAFWFAVLLNLKHIFMYVAPAYGVYLLRNYCFVSTPQTHSGSGEPVRWRSFSPSRFAKLAAIVAIVFLISFGPFIAMGQLGQVLSRLFPFKRGLSHAYWAPNLWALYNMADKLLTVVAKCLGIKVANQRASMTGGLVQEFHHTILPTVPPLATFILTFISITPSLVKLWKCPGNPLHFVRCLVLCALSAFMFGWHVHEKAILIVIVPLTLLAVVWRKEAQVYLLLSTVGHFSLFPLLFTPSENYIKVVLFLLHSVYAFQKLSSLFDITEGRHLPLLSVAESLYVFSLAALFVTEYAVFPLIGLTAKYPFLPLMLTSVHCAMGVLYCWLRYYWHFMTMDKTNRKRKAY